MPVEVRSETVSCYPDRPPTLSRTRLYTSSIVRHARYAQKPISCVCRVQLPRPGTSSASMGGVPSVPLTAPLSCSTTAPFTASRATTNPPPDVGRAHQPPLRLLVQILVVERVPARKRPQCGLWIAASNSCRSSVRPCSNGSTSPSLTLRFHWLIWSGYAANLAPICWIVLSTRNASFAQPAPWIPQ